MVGDTCVGAERSSNYGQVPAKSSTGDQAKFEKSLANGEKASQTSTGEKPTGGKSRAASASGAPVGADTKPTTGVASHGPEGAQQAPSEEQAQKEMFETFTAGLDPDAQMRLSTWLPDVLNGGKKDLKEAAQGLSARQAADLNALAKSRDIDAEATEATPVENKGKGLLKGIAAAVVKKANIEPLQQLQQAFGEHSLKESTPGLAPTTSYDTGKMPKAADSAVYANFTKGLDEATKQQLLTWLPAALDDPSKAPKDPNGPQSDALAKLAKLHGLEKKDARLKSVMTEYHRDKALATAGELPTVVDMMLVQHDGKDEGGTAAEIKVNGDNINARVAQYEKAGFGALDSWLPRALAGQGEIPKGDAEAMALLNRFATNMGFEGGSDATTEEAFAYLDQSGAIEKALHAGSTDKEKSFLLFSDSFLDSTLKYGAKNGALNQEMMADAAGVAEMLLGPDDGSNAPRQVDAQALMAAVLHRTGQPLERQQELMAAAGYINKAETLGEQKTRLAETVLAFHVREKIGTPPMTARQWGESYAAVHPDLYGQVDERAFNSPTSEKMQIITAHLGVPGDHKFMIDEKRKIKMSNDDLGNVESFDLKKKKTKWYKSVIDIAVPVVATILTFTPFSAVGVAMNVAYSAYKGAQAIKNGDLLGGALAIAGGVTGGAASYLGSAATVATTAAKGVAVANGALSGYRAAKSGDILGVVTSGLGAAAGGGAGRGFQTAATGINAGRAIESGDYLAAGAGVASLAGDAASYHGADGAQYAFQGVEQGLNLANAIDDKNYAGIGSAASGLLQTGHDYHDYRDDKAKQERANAAAKNAPTTDENGNKVILRAGHQNGERGITVEGAETPTTNNIEVASGDTLSQIAERHDTTVEALLMANPGISDASRIRAGEQLALPTGVQPVGTEQQDRLREFELVNGGGEQLLGGTSEDTLQGKRLSTFQSAASIADAELEVGMQLYQQEAKSHISAINQEVAEIDQKIDNIGDKAYEDAEVASEVLNLRTKKRHLLEDGDALQEILSTPEATKDALRGGSEVSDLRPEILEKVVGARDVVLDQLRQKKAEYFAAANPADITDRQKEVFALHENFAKIPELGRAYQIMIDQEAKLNRGETIYVPKDVPQSWPEYVVQEGIAMGAGGLAAAPIKGSKLIKNVVDFVAGTSTSQSLASNYNTQGEITIKLRDDGVYEVMVPKPYDENATWALKMSHYDLHQDGSILHKEDAYGGGNLGLHPQTIKVNKYVDGPDLKRLTNGGVDFSNGQITIHPDIRDVIDSLLSSGK